jgi:hypothetical protein
MEGGRGRERESSEPGYSRQRGRLVGGEEKEREETQ